MDDTYLKDKFLGEKKTDSESGGTVAPARGQQVKEVVTRVSGVFDDVGGSAEVVCCGNVLQRGQ